MIFSAAPFQSLAQSCRDSAVALLYPTRCRVCSAMIDALDEGVACRRCWQEAEEARLDEDYCVKCDAALPRLQLQAQGRRCGECDELAFTAARSCGLYRGAFRESVLRLKVQPELPAHLCRLLHETFRLLPNAQAIEAILPVPLHPTREQERQFNQAEILARALSRTTALPVLRSALIRIKATELHRGGMDAQARQQSLRGAFAVRAPRLIERRTLLLVDDVMTSGATAHEVAQTLRASGAHDIGVLTLARASSVLS